jgi:hypothetical protein
MKKYRIVQKLDSDKKFYYIVQQRKYLFFWGLPNWRISCNGDFIDTCDGLSAPPDYTYRRFIYSDFDDLRMKINKILKKEKKAEYHVVIQYF